MSYTVKNLSDRDLSQVETFISRFFPYAEEKLGFDKPVDVVFKSDSENARKILGKTAYYDPESLKIVLYVDDRHPKDILRSFSHELVHHAQNCRGEFGDNLYLGDGYAQNNAHMRRQEAEAYLLGNGFLFRDFEDSCKSGGAMITENQEKEQKTPETEQVSDKQWKEKTVYEILKKKWTKKEKNNNGNTKNQKTS
tara:strand:+ start:528 stop:1112 length:585 start_codon:yes stop_codon:yes gene_type:complete